MAPFASHREPESAEEGQDDGCAERKDEGSEIAGEALLKGRFVLHPETCGVI